MGESSLSKTYTSILRLGKVFFFINSFNGGSSSGEEISGRDDGGPCSPCTRKQPGQAISERAATVWLL